jgi:hypothetical protein
MNSDLKYNFFYYNSSQSDFDENLFFMKKNTIFDIDAKLVFVHL